MKKSIYLLFASLFLFQSCSKSRYHYVCTTENYKGGIHVGTITNEYFITDKEATEKSKMDRGIGDWLSITTCSKK